MTNPPTAGSKFPAPAKAGADHFMRRRSIRVMLLLLPLAAGALLAGALDVGVVPAHASAPAVAYRDGPPFGFSGGFGEDHCQACHNSEKLNVAPGRLTMSTPERYAAGETYAVTITLSRPGMKIGGFQFTARFEDDSTQAGTMSLADGEQGRMKISVDRDVQYAYHRRPGTQLTGPDVIQWTLRWTAPEGKRVVIFNAAGNAANADEANSGDFIYTTRARTSGR